MANNNEDGVWRTIGGRRVFIKTGQSLSEAMIKSGKFKGTKGIQREGYTNEEYQKQEDKIAQLRKDYRALETEVGAYDDDEFMSGSPAHDELKWELRDKEDELREAQNKYREMEKKPYTERKMTVSQNEKENLDKLTNEIEKENKKEQYENEFQEREKKIKAMNPNDKNYDVEKNHLESQQRDLVAKINELDKKEENEHNKKMLKEMERRLSKKDLSDEQREKIEDRASKYESAINEYESNKETKQKGGFYTRKDGTKEYDPHKGTEYEIKYDSMEDVMKDPNSAMNKYIREQNEKKAYKKYLKLHPESEMSFEEFKKQK